jgi:cytochrome c biogenesis protein CcmG/thiol:disulfide interchange protein DsbE
MKQTLLCLLVAALCFGAEKPRKAAPEFSLKDVNGNAVSLSSYKGKVVLLDFWATWCIPCKAEIPWFTEFEGKYKDKGFAVVGVSLDEEGWNVVTPYIAKVEARYQILMGDEATAKAYGGVKDLPTTLLIDREGNIIMTHKGFGPKKMFEKAILTALQ